MKSRIVMIVFLVCILLTGCFSTTVGHSWNGDKKVYLHDRVICFTLDVVTLPIQFFIFGPMIVDDINTCLYYKTKEGKRRLTEYEDSEKYVNDLNNNPNCIFTNPDFMCITNRAIILALNDWFAHGVNTLSRDEFDKHIEFILNSPNHLRTVDALWDNRNISDSYQREGFNAAVRLYIANGDDASRRIVSKTICNANFTDQELNDMLNGEIGKNYELRKIICRIIEHRKQDCIYELKDEKKEDRLYLQKPQEESSK